MTESIERQGCPNKRYNCSGYATPDYDTDLFFQCRKCKKDIRKQALAKNIVQPFYIAAIRIDRCYGGPEEGGWYYDNTVILEVRKAFDLKTGLKHARELRSETPETKYSRFSVLGREDYEIRCYYNLEDLPEETTEKPRYE